MRRIVKYINSLLLIVLGISMLLLWTGYIYIQFDPTETNALSLENNFWIFTNDSEHSAAVADGSFFSPISVSIILSGKGYTSAYDPQLTDILYSDCTPLITQVFSSSYICEVSTADAWNEALSYEDFILIEYTSQLPYTYISKFLHMNGELCTGDVCYTEKLLLFNDSRNVLSALSVDRNGNVYSFLRKSEDTPSLIYDFNSNNLAAYTVNEGFIPFEFNRSADGKKAFESLPSEYKLLLFAPSLPSITVNSPLQYIINEMPNGESSTYFELITDKALSEILGIFNVNPNIVGFYSDSSSGLYFVGENMHLAISPYGRVTYSVTDKNNPTLSVASLLDTTHTKFTSDEILTAATVFVSQFSSDMLGGGASPILKKVSYSSASDEISFTFGYYYLLSELSYRGDSEAITLTFNENGLISADFIPVSVTEAENDNADDNGLINTDMIPFLAAQIAEDGFSLLQPIYAFDSFGETVTPYWATGGYANGFE